MVHQTLLRCLELRFFLKIGLRGVLGFRTHNWEIGVDSHSNSSFGQFEAKISTEEHSIYLTRKMLYIVLRATLGLEMPTGRFWPILFCGTCRSNIRCVRTNPEGLLPVSNKNAYSSQSVACRVILRHFGVSWSCLLPQNSPDGIRV